MEQSMKVLSRDCEAVRIPSGESFTLSQGATVRITQALGGSYTVAGDFGLARIVAKDADALGMVAEPATTASASGPEGSACDGVVSEEAVWAKLRTCYDPEIPVNIVDLGLVYDCLIEQAAPAGVSVTVKMTLTAPGCGMGPTIAAEARSKILDIPGIADAEVLLVWDPPWNQAMISEVGKMQLGLI
jgi:probable FeS assembly SUF system protein SufT